MRSVTVAREDRLAALAALAEPLRRSLYLHVAASSDAVSREDAAEAVGISRSVAAFHLDKLAELGVLEVEFRRPPGRGGPGAGRPAKLYRRADDELGFTVPERHYDLAASILAQAVADAQEQSIPVDEALGTAARARGRAMATPPGAGASARPPSKAQAQARAHARVAEVLAAHGYEPCREGDRITLENCPFHALAEQHRALVCGMNLGVIEGILEGAGAEDVEASLEPETGRCCVTMRAG
jgi:predicted ArsR family transcriptional regulator